MTDRPATHPQPGNPQQAPLHAYRIRLLNGETFDIASPLEWMAFWSVVARDRYLVSPGGFIPYHAIGSIVPIESSAPASAQVIKLVHDVGRQA